MFGFRNSTWGWFSVAAVLLTAAWYKGYLPDPRGSAAAAPAAVVVEATPLPMDPAVFAAAAIASQRAALARHPQLGLEGAPLNKQFLRRYNELKERNDPSLLRPDWPERLANECAANPLVSN